MMRPGLFLYATPVFGIFDLSSQIGVFLLADPAAAVCHVGRCGLTSVLSAGLVPFTALALRSIFRAWGLFTAAHDPEVGLVAHLFQHGFAADASPVGSPP